jgi:hypothetical protein
MIKKKKKKKGSKKRLATMESSSETSHTFKTTPIQFDVLASFLWKSTKSYAVLTKLLTDTSPPAVSKNLVAFAVLSPCLG